ncbi:DUF692 domain-containing protein [Nocardia gipuzkoensis]
MNIGLSYRPNFRGFCFSADGRKLLNHLELPVEHVMGHGVASASALRLSDLYPIVLHGVSQSFGSDSFPARADSTAITSRAVRQIRPVWVGDHLSTSFVNGHDTRQLLPVKRTREAAAAIARRAESFRTSIGVPVVLEYIANSFEPGGELTEAEFLNAILLDCGCGLLLDLHNLYANSLNFGFDAARFLRELPMDRIEQIHIAGGAFSNGFYFDSHNADVPDAVWCLLEEVLAQVDAPAITLERDGPDSGPDDIIGDLETAARLARQAGRRPMSKPRNSVPGVADLRRPGVAKDPDFVHARRSRTCATIRKQFPLSWAVAELQLVENWEALEQAGARYAAIADKAAAAVAVVTELLPLDQRWRIAVDIQLSRLAFAADTGGPVVVHVPVDGAEYVLRRNEDLTITVEHRSVSKPEGDVRINQQEGGDTDDH